MRLTSEIRLSHLCGKFAHAGEELHVGAYAGVGEAALDVVDAELVELSGDLDLIVDRERNALCLCTIAQGGVIQQKVGHGSPPIRNE